MLCIRCAKSNSWVVKYFRWSVFSLVAQYSQKDIISGRRCTSVGKPCCIIINKFVIPEITPWGEGVHTQVPSQCSVLVLYYVIAFGVYSLQKIDLVWLSVMLSNATLVVRLFLREGKHMRQIRMNDERRMFHRNTSHRWHTILRTCV